MRIIFCKIPLDGIPDIVYNMLEKDILYKSVRCDISISVLNIQTPYSIIQVFLRNIYNTNPNFYNKTLRKDGPARQIGGSLRYDKEV